MAKWAHQDVLDNGLNYIKNNCNKVVAVIAYTSGDSYATVMTAGNIVAEATLTSGDFVLSTSGNDRVLTFSAGKQDTAANNTGDPTHFAFVDTANSKVLWVTTESSGQTVTVGNITTFPSLTYTNKQPV
jgi:hypothetical protein